MNLIYSRNTWSVVNEKNELERWAVYEFAKLFSARAGRGTLRFVKLLEPPSPDALCELNDSDVYIEVAHVYGSETDAKKTLGRRGKGSPDPTENQKDALIHLGSRVIVPLNLLLSKKAGKCYDKSPVWLLVRSGFPLMDLEDFNRYKGDVNVPTNHKFDEIWLLCGKSANSGALRLA